MEEAKRQCLNSVACAMRTEISERQGSRASRASFRLDRYVEEDRETARCGINILTAAATPFPSAAFTTLQVEGIIYL